jgi:lipopolysaccharide/colanic/teichoic acid biosynthesis glycosyltransferase
LQQNFNNLDNTDSCLRISDNGTQHNTKQQNTTQHNTTQHNTTQNNTTQHNTTQQTFDQYNHCFIFLVTSIVLSPKDLLIFILEKKTHTKTPFIRSRRSKVCSDSRVPAE